MSARDDALLGLRQAPGTVGDLTPEDLLDQVEAEAIARAADRPVNETLVKARAAAAAMFEVEAGERFPMWRVIVTDSESPTGVAPVCNATGDDDLHLRADLGHGVERIEDGVWDCCPTPQFETYSPVLAEYLVELLNADTAAGEQQ